MPYVGIWCGVFGVVARVSTEGLDVDEALCVYKYTICRGATVVREWK